MTNFIKEKTITLRSKRSIKFEIKNICLKNEFILLIIKKLFIFEEKINENDSGLNYKHMICQKKKNFSFPFYFIAE